MWKSALVGSIVSLTGITGATELPVAAATAIDAPQPGYAAPLASALGNGIKLELLDDIGVLERKLEERAKAPGAKPEDIENYQQYKYLVFEQKLHVLNFIKFGATAAPGAIPSLDDLKKLGFERKLEVQVQGEWVEIEQNRLVKRDTLEDLAWSDEIAITNKPGKLNFFTVRQSLLQHGVRYAQLNTTVSYQVDKNGEFKGTPTVVPSSSTIIPLVIKGSPGAAGITEYDSENYSGPIVHGEAIWTANAQVGFNMSFLGLLGFTVDGEVGEAHALTVMVGPDFLKVHLNNM